MPASDIIAVIGALTGAGGLITAVVTARGMAKKDDLDVLRGIIENLRTENTRLENENQSLRERVQLLENIIRANFAPVPNELDRRTGRGLAVKA